MFNFDYNDLHFAMAPSLNRFFIIEILDGWFLVIINHNSKQIKRPLRGISFFSVFFTPRSDVHFFPELDVNFSTVNVTEKLSFQSIRSQ